MMGFTFTRAWGEGSCARAGSAPVHGCPITFATVSKATVASTVVSRACSWARRGQPRKGKR
eukprot:12459942-Alexandrium_andersonii.AAC.1